MIVLAILNYDYKNLIMLVLFLSQLKGHMLPVFFTQLTEKLIQPRVNIFLLSVTTSKENLQLKLN